MYLRLISPLKTSTRCVYGLGRVSRRLSTQSDTPNPEPHIDQNQQLNFILGKRESPSGEQGTIRVTEPASGRIMCEAKESGEQDVHRAVEAAKVAFESWSSTSWMERGKVISKAARIVRARLEDIAAVEVADSGIYVFCVCVCVYILFVEIFHSVKAQGHRMRASKDIV